MNLRTSSSSSGRRKVPKRRAPGARAATNKAPPKRATRKAKPKTQAQGKSKVKPTAKAKPTARAKAAEARAKAKASSRNRRKPARKPRVSAPTPWRERLLAIPSRMRAWWNGRPNLRRQARAVALLVLCVGAVVLVGRQTVHYARTADAFAVKEVFIEGNTRLGELDVRRASGLQLGSNAFEVSTEDARNHLLQHPWIKDATVVRKLPNRMRIAVVERVPVAIVALDQLYLVSEEGVLFKRLGVDDPADLPVITGIASERFYDDLDYRTAVLLRSMALLHDYEGAGLAGSEPVSEIHFDGAHGVELYVGEDGVRVRLGVAHHRQKLRRLRQVLARLRAENARPEYVYLDNTRSPERVTVRLQ